MIIIIISMTMIEIRMISMISMIIVMNMIMIMIMIIRMIIKMKRNAVADKIDKV